MVQRLGGVLLAQEIDVKDLKRRRRAKKAKRFFKKLIGVLLIAVFAVLVYYTKDRWIPFFDGIATRYLPASQNTGELAAGNFPIKITGSSNYKVETMENAFALLDDANFCVYSVSGEKMIYKQNHYANPFFCTNSKKALVYDMGGKNFSLESKYKTIYEKKIEDAIIFARLGGNDYAAVVTKSDSFVSVMTVYNGYGEEIFKWKSVDSRIADVAFLPSGTGCVVATIDASNGQLVSELHRFNFDQKDEIWNSSDIDTMVLALKIMDDGTIVEVGDTKCAYYSSAGEYIGSYAYKTSLVDYSVSGQKAALLLENEERRKSSLVIIGDIKEDIKEINVSDSSKQVLAEGEKVLLMTENSIDEYASDGSIRTSVKISDDYMDFHKIGNYIFLLGYSDINRIDFNG
jgi:hypothetical protein